MTVVEALKCLGASRVIWIDDEFNKNTIDLARMLVDHIEVTRTCLFPELAEIVENFDSFESTAEDDIRACLENDAATAERIQSEFLAKLAEQGSAQSDLSRKAIDRVCLLLNVGEEDRLPFDGMEQALATLCKGGADNGILYIVDLNDALTNDENRGLDVLVSLNELQSRGTAFLLTRETDVAGEAAKEVDVRAKLKEKVGFGKALSMPTCVIAKDRLFDHDDEEITAEALRIAIKRAGLRRSIHEALWKAEEKLRESFCSAADSLTRIPPEKLEAFVVEKSFREGVSELHVVERALTAHMARDIRNLFGTDLSLIESAKRMRALRAIKLAPFDSTPDEQLEMFRKAEIWEEPELINSSLSPVTCGDVFEAFPLHDTTDAASVKFLLLGQPCDVALRPNGKRGQNNALFVPLKEVTVGEPKSSIESEHNEEATDIHVDAAIKKPMLPFKLDQVQYACDFRNATNVRMEILDLASFRKDGLVQIDGEHVADVNLLPGQARAYKDRTKAANQLLNPPSGKQAAKKIVDQGHKLQLTFDTDKVYRQIAHGILQDALPAGESGQPPASPKRVTWSLRRCGRIRMPYAAALLESYVNVMSRRAFDFDYTDASPSS